MSKIFITLLFFQIVFIGCGGSSSTSPSSSGGGSSGTDSGTGAFTISGSLLTTSVSSQVTLPNGKAQTTTKKVTHVMAINPSSQNASRKLVKVDSENKFSLGVSPLRPYVLVYIDSSQKGKEMIVSIFKENALDSIPPFVSTGSLDLGSMGFSGRAAKMGIDFTKFLSALGMSQTMADYMGKMDDLCLRYVNPDIDGDGTIDIEEKDHNFMLDFHVRYDMKQGSTKASVANIIDSFLASDTTTVDYTGAGIFFSFPENFSTGDLSTQASVVFQQDLHYQPGGTGATQTVLAGTAVTGSNVSLLNFSGHKSFGIGVAVKGFDLPQGEYQFKIGSTSFTFTDVKTRTDSEFSTSTDMIMPFIKINKKDSNCSSDCTLGSIDYKWMKKTSAAWTDASLDEIKLIVSDQGGYISFNRTFDNATETVGFTIPMTAVSGNIAWTAANARLTNMTETLLLGMKTTEICHLGLSYDDKLGMRIFSGIANAPNTCSNKPA